MSASQFPVKSALDALLDDLRAMPAREVEQVVEVSGLARSLVWKFRYEGHAIRAQTAIRIEEGIVRVKQQQTAAVIGRRGSSTGVDK